VHQSSLRPPHLDGSSSGFSRHFETSRALQRCCSPILQPTLVMPWPWPNGLLFCCFPFSLNTKSCCSALAESSFPTPEPITKPSIFSSSLPFGIPSHTPEDALVSEQHKIVVAPACRSLLVFNGVSLLEFSTNFS